MQLPLRQPATRTFASADALPQSICKLASLRTLSGTALALAGNLNLRVGGCLPLRAAPNSDTGAFAQLGRACNGPDSDSE